MRNLYLLLLLLIPLAILSGNVYAQDFQIVSVTSEPTTCYDNEEGSITVAVSGGSPDYSYMWVKISFPFGSEIVDSPHTEHTFTNLSRGNYIIYVNYANSEEDALESVISVGSPPRLFVGITPDPAETCVLTGLSLNGNPSGGTGSYFHEWSDGGSLHLSSDAVVNPIFNAPLQGVFPLTYTVTDDNGCEASDMIDVVVYPELSAIAAVTANVQCYDGNDGEITISSPMGGTGNFEYRISGSVWQTGTVFQGLSAGLYDVYMRDTSVDICEKTIGLALEVTQPDQPLDATVTAIENVSCFGGDDGSVTVEGNGGTAPYRYSLNGGPASGSGVFGGLAAGDHMVMVIDDNDCTFDVPVTISQPSEALEGAVTEIMNVSCFMGDDGSVTVEGSGGTAPYSYSLDGGPASGSGVYGGLAAGDYLVTVIDGNDCTFDIPVTISQPSEALEGVVTEIINVSCFMGDDGSVTVEGSGGTAPYSYSLDGGPASGSGTFGGLTAGDYLVTVIDGNDCTFDLPVTISQPLTSVEGAVTEITDVSCFGGDDGSVTVEGSGGTAPYSYSLDGGSASGSGVFGGLQAGDYVVTIIDGNDCTFDVPVTISQPGEFTITAEWTGISCYNAADGEVVVTAAGGTAPYEYSVFIDEEPDYQESPTFSGLDQDIYTVLARDAKMCLSNQIVIEITEPDQVFVGFNAPAIETCFGDPGAITLTASGGTGNFEYSISTTQYVPADFQSSNIFDNLSGDVAYYAFVRDTETNCTVNVNAGNSITIDQPTEIVYSVTEVKNVTGCSFDTNGRIRISLPAGGSSPYRYLINGVNNGSRTFSDLGVGDYLIEVEDNKGCRKPESVTLTGPDPVVVDNFTLTGVTGCYGDTNGEISVQASGGAGGLEYSIDGVDFFASGDFDNLAAVDHTVTVRDANGCEFNFTYTLTGPDELLFASVQVNDIIIGSGEEFGSVLIGMSGGTEPYIYSIDEGSNWQDESFFGSLLPGDYDILVSDANGCIADTSVTIAEVPGIEASADVQPPSCFGYEDGMIVITAEMGNEPFEYSIDDGQMFYSSGIFTGLPAGTYRLHVRDAMGYLWEGTVVIGEPDPIEISATVVPASCSNFSPDGEIEIEATGGTGSYSYLWSNELETPDIEGVLAGEYIVLVTDENGCTESLSVNVGYVHLLEVSLPQQLTVCSGEEVELTSSVQQSGASAVYSWVASEGPDPDPVASPIVAPVVTTSYMLTVTDENGCYDEAGVLVDHHPLEGIFIGNDTVIFQGSSIILEAKGGEFVSYEWTPSTGLSEVSGPVTTATVMNPIRYFVYAETALGCTESADIFVDIILPVKPVSGFTPNDDGVNDFFDIVNAEDYPNIEVEVYNRSGQRVFQARGYSDDKRWDGTYNGRELPMGTYYYVIRLNDIFGTKPLTGPVTIVR
jgi:gliding motility-associated-like protein